VKVLVTGGAGFVGSHVVDRCLKAGHEVAVVDDLSTGRRDNVSAAARLHVADIRSPALHDVFRAEAPAAVVHLAAQASVSRSVANPHLDAEINVLGSINVLECCRRAGARRVVYVSTGGAAYGDTGVIPTTEDHPTRPVSPYGVSKVAAELYLG
jgi:UDP-glucose 4-epimerase